MQRTRNYHVSHARLAAGGGSCAPLKAIVGRIRCIAKGYEMKAGAISLLTTLLVAMAPLVVGAKNVPLRYTRRLPPIDKVELQKVQSAELGVRSVEEVKVVEGTQAEAIAALWRTQNFRSLSPECHQPAYAIKFYARGKLLLYASLCWDCDNIDFIEPTLNASQGFNGSSRKGQALLALLRRSFP